MEAFLMFGLDTKSIKQQVELNRNSFDPIIIYKYPEQETTGNIEKLCFPKAF